jgi:hypothetical protein
MRYDSGLCGFSGRNDSGSFEAGNGFGNLGPVVGGDSRVQIYPTHVQEEV